MRLRSTRCRASPFNEDDLNNARAAMSTGYPYLTTILWRSRAQRALRLTGDPADTIISFQIAAESLIYDTYRMLLIDEGHSSTEIADLLRHEVQFKSMLTNLLPAKLGGQWDVTRAGSPVCLYWNDLYLVRNAIVHTGFKAHGGHADEAQAAYRALRDHLEERLWAKHTSYPRSVLARFGRSALEAQGRWVRAMQDCAARFESEPGPWHLPHDLAGRPRVASS
jgi:hypothetical protein